MSVRFHSEKLPTSLRNINLYDKRCGLITSRIVSGSKTTKATSKHDEIGMGLWETIMLAVQS